MNFSYKHLLDFLEEKPSRESLSETLFKLGHENTYIGDIFDLELTPNRGDCLSLLGIARDLNYFYRNKKKFALYDDEIDILDFNFVNHEVEACPNISFLLVEIEHDVKAYESYLERFFQDLGNKKVNFFTDVSNYVSYELGQPSHAYEFESVKDGLVLESLKEKKTFETLLGQEINLREGDLVFTTNNNILSLAGIMGGMKSSCSSNTRKALIEFAHFKPSIIAGKSSLYNLNSEAAHKFERYVDPALVDLAHKRFTQIIKDHTEIKELKLLKFGSNDHAEREIDFNEIKINKILGCNFSKEKIHEILKGLSFKIFDHRIEVPSFRIDIENSNDISEEVARVAGYDSIELSPFSLKEITKGKDLVGNLKNFLITNGFTEVINFQFSKNKTKNSISVDNPLDVNKGFMRTNICESLLENLLYNENRQKDSIKLFEISDIYTKGKQGIERTKSLGIILSGRVGHNYRDFSKKIDEKFIKDIFNKIDFDISKYVEIIDRRSLDTKRKDKIISVNIPIKDLLRSFENKIDLPKRDHFKDFRYEKISEFPSSFRDFSFLVDHKESINLISEIILNFESDIVKDAFLFDFYENKKNKNFKAGFRLIFQDLSKTLTDERISNEIDKLLSKITNLKNVSMPGYNQNVF